METHPREGVVKEEKFPNTRKPSHWWVLFFFPPGYVALWDSKTPHRPASERVFWCLETSPLLRLPPWDGSPSLTLCLSFYLSYFVLPPFKDNGLPFWVPGVLHQCSEVVLWYLLSVQVLFRWICGGEIGLPVLFLCHLRTTPLLCLLAATILDSFFLF